MTNKNETASFIKYFGNAKNQLTEPETVVRGILKELGYGYRIQESIGVSVDSQDPRGEVVSLVPSHGASIGARASTYSNLSTSQSSAAKSLTLTIDLFIPEHKICVEVDGIHHRTARQERKTAWRDAQLIANGYKVLHIDAKWTETKERQEKLKDLIEEGLDTLKQTSPKFAQTWRIAA